MSHRPVVILGGGGHGRVVLDTLRAMNIPVLGVIDPGTDLRLPAGIRQLGSDLSIIKPSDGNLVLGVGSINTAQFNPRPKLYKEGKAAGFEFTSLRHPSAIVAPDVQLGEGSQILAGAILQAGVRIGANVIINTGASIDHDCYIADHVHIAPGAILSGDVRVDEGVHIGPGAVVIQGLKIEREAMIGAGVIVTKSVSGRTRLRPPSLDSK